MRNKSYRYINTWAEETDPDILFSSYVAGLEINLEIAKELIDNRLDFTNNEPVYVVIDFTHVKSVTKEARDYMNSADGGLKGILGGAFLSNSVVSTLFINLHLRMSNPSIPAKFFTNREEAVKWLKKIKSKNIQTVL